MADYLFSKEGEILEELFDKIDGLPDAEELDRKLSEKIDDAPSDGKQYARENGAWTEVQGGPGGTDNHAELENLDYEHSGHTGFQPAIPDLPTIRTGAEKGATALQSGDMAEWAKQPNKPSYTASEVGALPETTQIPSKTSDLANDAGFQNASQVAGAVEAETLRATAKENEIEAAIPDVSAFITKSVNDLVNYYKKSETYTQEEVRTLINAVQQFTYEVVPVLPAASASTMHKIYLVPSANPQSQNTKDEFITIQSGQTYSWEQIGTTAIDLGDYPTTAQMNTAISNALTTALADYITTTALTTLLAGKQDKIDGSHKLSYNLLSDTPTIPEEQIQSDWAQSDDTAKDFIKNKPDIATEITPSSTNTDAAGAKAVYDFVTETVGDIETLLSAI